MKITRIKFKSCPSLEFQKVELEAEVEVQEDENIENIQFEINQLAIEGLKDLVFKKRKLKEGF